MVYVGSLVNPGLVHYNRNGWMQTHRWNAGYSRRICYIRGTLWMSH
jgi:hypothetical protein